ncbi:hypothetical protein HYX70_00550 [Candidatus Saccharibacteria bacterium]|nr:hypothetical protein [Candidatus Saccharibacteria bacterium]
MAGIVTHIALSDKVFKNNFSNFNLEEFVLGTSFADIRYLGVIDRNKTHYKNISMQAIKESNNSFTAGLMFHSLVDEVRENYIRSHEIYNKLPRSDYVSQAMKFCEDIDIYSECSNWGKYTDYFDSFSVSEENYGIRKKDLLEWHKIVQQAIISKPNLQVVKQIVLKFTLSPEAVDEILSVAKKIQENVLAGYIHDFYGQFGELCK